MPFERLYGASATVQFPLVDRNLTSFDATPVTFAAGDVRISQNGGAFVNTTNLPTHVGLGVYQLVLTATEMQTARIAVVIIDQTNPKDWEDQAILINTFGNASAQFAFNRSQANVTVGSIVANAITATAIQDNAITAAKIAANAITSAKIAADAIGATQIAANAITAAKIATDAITSAKIAANAITAAKIAADAIGSVQIADGAITAAKLATGAITAAKFAANAITATVLAADSITDSQFEISAANKIRDTILSDATPFAGANVDATVSSRATPAQVNTEVSDVLKTDTIPELAQGALPATPTFQNALMAAYMALRNRVEVTASEKRFYDDAGTAIHKKMLSDNGTTYVEEESITGP